MGASGAASGAGVGAVFVSTGELGAEVDRVELNLPGIELKA